MDPVELALRFPAKETIKVGSHGPRRSLSVRAEALIWGKLAVFCGQGCLWLLFSASDRLE